MRRKKNIPSLTSVYETSKSKRKDFLHLELPSSFLLFIPHTVLIHEHKVNVLLIKESDEEREGRESKKMLCE